MPYALDIHYIDVGQGDCTLIVIREDLVDPNPGSTFDQRIRRTLLIDCGTTSTSSSFRNTAESSLLEKLTELRVEHLNIVIVTHFDEDHFSGIVALLEYAKMDPNIRRLFQGTLLYDQGLVYRKLYGIMGFTSERPNNINSLPGFPLINKYLQRIYELNRSYNTGIQRMTQRVFTGYPLDYENGVWKNFNRAQYQSTWETGKFDNTLDQIILVQDYLWQPTDHDEGYYGEIEIDEITYYRVQTLPCHHFVGIDLLNYGFDHQINGIELWCTAANGYTAQVDIAGNVTPQLAYLNDGDWNTFSMGFLLCHNNFTHWFGGDLEILQEESCLPFILQKTQGHRLTSMKASHHGSNKSSSLYFLSNVSPELVIISCGNWSQHHHPHIEVIQRLSQLNPAPPVIMTNAPVYEELKYGVIPTFYDPGGVNTQFYISGSSLEQVIGNISLHCSLHGRSVTYWEQNHQISILSDDLAPEIQANTNISMAQFLRLLVEHSNYHLTSSTDVHGFRSYVLLDFETGDVAGSFDEDCLFLIDKKTPFGRLFGRIQGGSFNVSF